jgi:hypothetical protein
MKTVRNMSKSYMSSTRIKNSWKHRKQLQIFPICCRKLLFIRNVENCQASTEIQEETQSKDMKGEKREKNGIKTVSIAVTPIQTVPSSAKPLATCLSLSPPNSNPNPPDHQIPPLQRSLSHLDHSEGFIWEWWTRPLPKPDTRRGRASARRRAAAQPQRARHSSPVGRPLLPARARRACS